MVQRTRTRNSLSVWFLPRSRAADTDTAPETVSPLFALAPELRAMILRHAFGDRKIHLDARPRGYRSRQVVSKLPRQGWRRLIPWLASPPPRTVYGQDSDVPNWTWYSCVCYANDAERKAADKFKHLWLWYPRFWDDCWRGGCWCCEPTDRGPLLDSDRVGAMGFLLSCKRAYNEGLYILYSTNLILLENRRLLNELLQLNTMPGIPQLIGPGLQLITSLAVSSTYYSPAIKDVLPFNEQVDLLPRVFPKLRYLRWTLGGHRAHGGPIPQEEVENAVLGPMLRAIAQLPATNKRIMLCMSEKIFSGVRQLARQQRSITGLDVPWESSSDPQMMTFWYPITEQGEMPGEAATGFWVMLWDSDYHPRLTPD
ncbi:hypothetical protein MFIFM68171_04877 [Madurella fahalii]|uniref:Uncharacterized protein n=1 Tax=Madurella fahalii TaxID=1157608 RepID=A0ABQ0GA87_9PEZI